MSVKVYLRTWGRELPPVFTDKFTGKRKYWENANIRKGLLTYPLHERVNYTPPSFPTQRHFPPEQYSFHRSYAVRAVTSSMSFESEGFVVVIYSFLISLSKLTAILFIN